MKYASSMVQRSLVLLTIVLVTFAAGTRGHAAPAGAIAFDDKVTITKAKCTTDCEARCKANEPSACSRISLRGHPPDALCDAGVASYCDALAAHANDGAARAKYEAKAKAANDRMRAGCQSGDARACMFAKPTNDADRTKLYTRACTLGLWGACVSPYLPAPTAAEQKHIADLAAKECTSSSDATICNAAAGQLRDEALQSALRTRGAQVAHALCRAGGIGAIEGCEWEAALTTTRAGADSQLTMAAHAAETECKLGNVNACLAAGTLLDKDPGSVGSVLMGGSGDGPGFILIERPGDAARAKPFYIEACKLAWKTDDMSDPFKGPSACEAAKAAGVDIMTLQPPPPSKPKPAAVRITPRRP